MAADLVVVTLFVVIGRDAHDEGSAIGDVLATSAPFLIAALAAWAIPAVRRAPDAVRTGAIVAGSTVAVGMVLRNFAFGDGTAPTFIVVSLAFLSVGMLGWRLIRRRWSPSSPARSSAPGDSGP